MHSKKLKLFLAYEKLYKIMFSLSFILFYVYIMLYATNLYTHEIFIGN